jgi:F-type H+-transporting ATPase subunit b
MKSMVRLLGSALLVGALLAMPTARLHAQAAASAPHPAAQRATVPNEEHMDAPDTKSDTEEYRHSKTVQSIAHLLHLKVETTAQIFEDLNSGVLILVLVVVLVKVVPGMFRKRTETLQKELTQAQAATQDANHRLAAVEARLSRLDGEIDAIRLQAERDAVEDAKRVHANFETERERIVASAEQEIAATQSAAQRELKKFAADLAIDQAMRRIQLSAETDRALVQDFGKGLSGGSGGKA